MLNYANKIRKLKHHQKQVCIICEKKTGQKDIDECFSCPYHILFNRMMAEINENGH